MADENIFMKVRKYIPNKYYGFLIDSNNREAFFHTSVFEAGAAEDSPPPVPNEEVLVTINFDSNSKDKVQKASRVRRLQPPWHLEGVVSFFNAEKGYGFIETDDKITYYLHRSEVLGGTLPLVGRKCSFYTSQKIRGARASYITIELGVTHEPE